ncbi:hypothetical protein [Synechococcus sp. CBW1004]|uniref:hypothetical protein n=1 Tax=Synechococcus sp. CBW1004 TaxID=1353136 RepID=UPI001E28765E|nr:hypothetical protein [Synechococcus sp. CBW1004]
MIVIPRPDGASCGLADHARVIAAEASRRGIPAHVCPWPQPWLPSPNTPVLLEFTPLAYSRVALPWRLLLRVLLRRLRGGRVVTYFHELPFTNGNTWKRQVAVLLQQFFCILFAGLSHQAVVNQQDGVRWLSWLRPQSPPLFLPSFSNVGESDHVSEPSDRPLQVVIFGSAGKRRHAHQLVAELGGYRQLFGPTVTVLDIGEPLALPSSLHEEVDILGLLPAEQVFAHLVQSRYGLFYSEPYQFSKSGVFAAYCASGVVPIISLRTHQHCDHFLSLSQITDSPDFLLRSDAVWVNCRSWYCQYSTKSCASEVIKAFNLSAVLA